MIIEINNSRTIREIREAFTGRFPFLKLEFFNESHEREAASGGMPCKPDLTLGEIRSKNTQGIITLDPDNETGAVEKEFERRFGLNVQVYRLQSGQWIQTAGTDILTLKEQNDIGRDSDAFYNPNHELKR